MPEYLSKNDCLPINPPGDGNCLYKSCLICINDNTTSNKDLRNELNKQICCHYQENLSKDNPQQMIEMVLSNLTDMDVKWISEQDALEKYTALMSNATPYECKYGTLLELYAFAHWKGVNIIVYDLYPYIGAREGTYKMCAVIHTSNDTQTIALLYDNQSQHYQALIRHKAYISNPNNNRKKKPTKDDAYWPTIKIEDKIIPPTNLQSNKINTKSVPLNTGNTTQIRSTHNPTFQKANEIDRLVDEIPHLWNHNSNSDTTGQGQFIRTEFS